MDFLLHGRSELSGCHLFKVIASFISRHVILTILFLKLLFV